MEVKIIDKWMHDLMAPVARAQSLVKLIQSGSDPKEIMPEILEALDEVEAEIKALKNKLEN